MIDLRKRKIATGITLILLGLVFYILERSEGLDAAAVFFLLGGAFLTGYVYRREYGLLVPAGVMLGLGTGTFVAQTQFDYGQPQLWGLGLGFIFIYVVALACENNKRWWPLIPGGVLLVLGLPRATDVLDFMLRNWPLVLIAIGVIILIGSLRSSSGDVGR